MNVKLVSVAFAVLALFAYYLKKLGRKGIMIKLVPYATSYIILNRRVINAKFSINKFLNSLRGRANVLTYYHDVFDPHCIAMLHVLPLITKRYSVKIEPKIVCNAEIELYGPKSNKFNIIDATIQLQYYSIPISLPLSDDHIKPNNLDIKQKLYDLSNSILIKYVNKTDPNNFNNFMIDSRAISDILWTTNMTLNEKYIKLEQYSSNKQLSSSKITNKIIEKCLKELHSNQHYLSGNIYFNSEWFPRIDRLIFLIDRLNEYKIDKTINNQNILNQKGIITLRDPFIIPNKLDNSNNNNNINLFWSFRSPYSYLVLPRIYKLCNKNNLKLNIFPVLPSIFRNVKISPLKSTYIPFDNARIADYLNMEFGCIFDVGLDIKMIELCFKLFIYAKSKGKEKEFILEIATDIWAKGCDIRKPENIQKIFKRCGNELNYIEYKNKYSPKYLKGDGWKKFAENNLNKLYETGNWGVPSIQFKDRCVWGQDRLWALSDEFVKIFPKINTQSNL